MSLRIGIDVGGTHTDAVLLDGATVLAVTKAQTTVDIESGVINALEAVLDAADRPRQAVQAVMIGTTQFTNAVIERQQLAATAIVRISLPAGRGVPPTCDWPPELARSLGNQVHMLPGGRRFDGRELAPIDDAATDRVIDTIAASGASCAAVTATFAPLDPTPELEFAERLTARLPHIRVVASHTIGRHGILERENAAALNAALLPLADQVVDSFERALAERGLHCPIYISQNDGTLMATAFARRFPALTFASGPTNSLRGASLLTGMDDAVVVDIGGTTSDVGVLRHGLPRQSSLGVEVGGVRTNFRMPDILAIGLGGGSLVSDDGRQVGPRSVGYRLHQDSRIFGGSTLTATDIAVAGGAADIGNRAHIADLSPATVAQATAVIHDLLDATIDRMRSSREPVPVILVGGGAVLVSQELRCASTVLRPHHADVANAIGAANAEVGGEAEVLLQTNRRQRADAIAEATEQAGRQAIRAGADPASLRTADIEEYRLAYMAEETSRIRVRVIGRLNLQPSPQQNPQQSPQNTGPTP